MDFSERWKLITVIGKPDYTNKLVHVFQKIHSFNVQTSNKHRPKTQRLTLKTSSRYNRLQQKDARYSSCQMSAAKTPNE